MTAIANIAGRSVKHVPESRFGVWFLGTSTWRIHVLRRAIIDLERLIPNRKAAYPVIVDVGCGWGHSFALLQERFSPSRMIGVDVDQDLLKICSKTIALQGVEVELHLGDSSQLPIADNSVDLLFCHQTFHHLVDQHQALSEFHRILKPGGILLFAESTRAYIHSWIIRLLFRHPMDVQRSASEYRHMIRDAGFDVRESSISYPFLWWSRTDLGILERWFGIKPAVGHEETLINLVAVQK